MDHRSCGTMQGTSDAVTAAENIAPKLVRSSQPVRYQGDEVSKQVTVLLVSKVLR